MKLQSIPSVRKYGDVPVGALVFRPENGGKAILGIKGHSSNIGIFVLLKTKGYEDSPVMTILVDPPGGEAMVLDLSSGRDVLLSFDAESCVQLGDKETAGKLLLLAGQAQPLLLLEKVDHHSPHRLLNLVTGELQEADSLAGVGVDRWSIVARGEDGKTDVLYEFPLKAQS